MSILERFHCIILWKLFLFTFCIFNLVSTSLLIISQSINPRKGRYFNAQILKCELSLFTKLLHYFVSGVLPIPAVFDIKISCNFLTAIRKFNLTKLLYTMKAKRVWHFRHWFIDKFKSLLKNALCLKWFLDDRIHLIIRILFVRFSVFWWKSQLD